MPRRRFAAALVAGLTIVAVLLPGCASDTVMPTLERRIRDFAPAVVEADLDRLPGSERAALVEIIEAAKRIDEIFVRQVDDRNVALRDELRREESAEGRRRLAYFEIMKGPWDRQDHQRPFATFREKPPGAGFYPEDMTRAEFERVAATSAEVRAALSSPVTRVERRGRDLVPVPYSVAYRELLERAARHLDAAAALTAEPTLRKFLRSRAEAFRTNDYYASELDWMDLASPLEVTIGPYETYEDELLGLKASFEAFVTVADPEASAALDRYKAELPEMERSLPLDERFRSTRGQESPIRVVDLVYSAGEARSSVQTIAFNLPNDERVRAEKGAKKVLLRNLIRTKFDLVLRPIAAKVLVDEQLPLLSADAFFHGVLFHELSHSLGPAYVERNGVRSEVGVVLGAHHAALEEAKADVMGIFNLLAQVRKGTFPAAFREEVIASHVAGLFRSVRFGLAEAHGRGAALQLSTLVRDGAIAADAEGGRFRVDFDRFETSNRDLLGEILLVQATGDAAGAERMLTERAVLPDSTRPVLASLADIPVDLRPIYPAAGE